MKSKLLIVEDDEALRTQMKWALSQDYEVLLAGDRPSALEILKRERPPAVILDLGLPPDPDGVDEGFQSLSEMLTEDTLIKVIVATGHDEREHALKAIGQGAYDFLSKPIQLDELRIILSRAFHVSQLERELGPVDERTLLLVVRHLAGDRRRIPWVGLVRVADLSGWAQDPNG